MLTFESVIPKPSSEFPCAELCFSFMCFCSFHSQMCMCVYACMKCNTALFNKTSILQIMVVIVALSNFFFFSNSCSYKDNMCLVAWGHGKIKADCHTKNGDKRLLANKN